MKRLLYFSSGLLVVVGLLFLASRPDAPTPPAPTSEAVRQDPAPAPVEMDELPAEVPDEVSDEPGPVAAVGRVVGPEFRPVGGVRLVLAEEATTTSEQGAFRFGPGVRPRSASLACELDGQATDSFDVVVGSMTGGDAVTSSFESAPAKLEWIRWTLNLFGWAGQSEGLWIHARAVLVEEWGNGGRVQVLGSTNLPDGAHISGSVYFDEMRSFSSFDSGEVTGGEFRVVLWGVAGH